MKYIRQKTDIPVPKIHGWDPSLANVLGAPYVIMDAVGGKPAWALWCARDELPEKPSFETYMARYRFLRNLDPVMAELRKLSFDKIGQLQFEHDPDTEDSPPPTVGHYFEYYTDRMHLQERTIAARDGELIGAHLRGGFIFSDLICGSILGVENTDESFLLTHPDLGCQDIWVDSDGNITGIIDWEDWDREYKLEKSYHTPWALDQYREIYTQAMKKALEPFNDDWRFTTQSGLYCAATEAVTYGGLGAFISRLFKEITPLRAVDEDKFLKKLGGERGWLCAEEMLVHELEKLFEPIDTNAKVLS
ncbi:hypothetical protein K458DRAFT_409564 [Lentithecium fluviatile CBS 122367]|uniref:Aminoglycoside phosphotransferase domain-containing protein n=1 Tax=Lentithecium fluviatile CBS 122367 TaxID=1168545 RepID=A0A6G1IH39_9PLEO|nr:hypothetical protein K458DRAFT_409564 [Lentithecium fluviatile CBS 122367]